MLYIQESHVWTEDIGQTLQEVERFLQLLLTSTAVDLPGAKRSPGPPLPQKHLSVGSPGAVWHLYRLLTCPTVPLPAQGKITVNTISTTMNKFWSLHTDCFQGISPTLEPFVSQMGACFFLSVLKYCKYKISFTFYPSSILSWAFIPFFPLPCMLCCI